MDRRTESILIELEREDNLRTLNSLRALGKYVQYQGQQYLNLSSNDYLGLATDTTMQANFFRNIDPCELFLMSNPSSRLMTGNSPEYENLENSIARLFGGERTALVLSSGYMVNSGVLPALTQKEDLIIADKLVHASVIDGLKLSSAAHIRFKHNDLEHLESLLKKHRHTYKDVWVVTESLFSMDGDLAPLAELVELKKRYDLKLYLDEAHAFGVYGKNGAGIAVYQGLQGDFDLIVATLGKAVASCGAFVVCNSSTRQLLVNRMRTLIFSTALPPINLMWSRWVVDRLSTMDDRRERLRELSKVVSPDKESTHIIPLMAYENGRALELSQRLKQEGYWINAIRTPTVAKGNARLRLSLCASIEPSDAIKFMELWNTIG